MIERGAVATAARAERAEQGQEDLEAVLPARSSHREIKVGFFVLLGIVAVLVALFTLTDAALFRGRYIVTTVIEDAGGLRRGDPVQMRGVNIGRIQRFEMVPEGVAVRLELLGEYGVPSDSRVVLRSSGLLGGMVAEVVPGTSSRDLRRGDVMPGATAEGFFDVAGDIGDRAEDALDRVRALLSETTVGAVGESARELQVLLAELSQLAAEQRVELARIGGSLRSSAAGLERATAGAELERIVARVDALTARLDETTVSLGRASGSLEVVLARLERGEGTLGRLTTDEALYDNLNAAAENLRLLAQDFRENPRRYIDLRIF